MIATNSEAETAEALKALFEQEQWLLRLAESLVQDHSAATDLAQETFLAALKNPPPNATRPRAWLSAVAHRIHRKQRARFSPVYVDDLDDYDHGSGPLPEEAAMRWESTSKLQEAVKSLKPLNQETVLLTYQEELGQAEVAKQLKVSTRTVRYRLKASHREIRKSLGGRRWTRNGAWVLPLIPILDPKTFRREAVTVAPGIGLGVLATIGGAVAVGVTVFGAMYMLDGSEVTPLVALGEDELSLARAEQGLSDSGASFEREPVPLDDPEDLKSPEEALSEASSKIRPTPPDSNTQEIFWVSLQVRPEGRLQEGLWATLSPEGFMRQGSAIPERKMALEDDGSARVGVQEEGAYKLVIGPGDGLGDGKPFYSRIELMAHRGDDLRLTLEIPETRPVTLRINQPKVWLYGIGQSDGWKIEAVGTAVGGKIQFADVPLGDFEVRTYLRTPNGNRARGFNVLGTITVTGDGENVFTVE